MRVKIGKSPIEAGELAIIGQVTNSLFLISSEESVPRVVSEQLLGMRSALGQILLAHEWPSVKTKIKKDGTLVQWPDSEYEKWEAIK